MFSAALIVAVAVALAAPTASHAADGAVRFDPRHMQGGEIAPHFVGLSIEWSLIERYSELPRIRAYAVEAPGGDVTAVLVNVEDPSAAESTDEVVTLNLPGEFRKASAVVLESSSPDGLGSTDAGGITLGGRDVTSKGVPRGEPKRVPLDSSTVTVAPGTAQIVTFER